MNTTLNPTEIHQLCNLDGVNQIYDLIGRMQILIDICNADPKLKHLNAFTHTYYLVTKQVGDMYLYTQQPFTSPADMEQFDIEFAKLYFSPLANFLTTGDISQPWENFFKYSRNHTPVAFVQMLLGINAHINGDLASVLHQSKYHHRQDYMLINDLLVDTIPSVMNSLALHDHDAWGFAGILMRKFVEQEFQNLVVKWRNKAWDDYQLLNTGEITLSDIHSRAEHSASEIIEIFHEHNGLNVPVIIERLRAVV